MPARRAAATVMAAAGAGAVLAALAAAATLACSVAVGLLAPAPAAAEMLKFDENNYTIAADLQLPEISAEELRRRRTTTSLEVKDEAWFKSGQSMYKVTCAGCHTMDPNKPDKGLLTTDILAKSGYDDPKRLTYIIRYGKKAMPGFGGDCFDLGDRSQCNAAVPMTEEQMQNVEDFALNRIADNWKPLPKPPRRT